MTSNVQSHERGTIERERFRFNLFLKQNLTKNEDALSSATVTEPLNPAKPDSPDSSMKLTSESNTLTIPGDATLKRSNSIRSNADIREVFSIVNGLSRHSSMNNTSASNRIDLEMTFPPLNHNRAKVILTNKNIYQIPDTLTDKINTLITTFQSSSKENIQYDNNNNRNNNGDNDEDDDEEERKNTLTGNNDQEKSSQHDSKRTNTFDRKFKFNYVNFTYSFIC